MARVAMVPARAAAGSGRYPGVRAAALVAAGVAVVGGLVAAVLHLLYADSWPPDLDPFWRLAVVWPLAVAAPGAVLAWRDPRNPVGALLVGSGTLLSVSEIGFAWTALALAVPGVDLPYHPVVTWLAGWLWVPGYMLVPTFVLLLVPEGRLPSRAWRAAVALDAVALVLGTVGFALTPWDRVDPPITSLDIQNPFGVPGAERLLGIALALFASGTLLSVASLVVRLARARSLERQQLKWVLVGAVGSVVMGVLGFLAPHEAGVWITAAAVLPLVAGTAVAVLRHRLWQVEQFIARSAVYGLLTLLVVAVYASVVGLVGARLGGGGASLVALVLVVLGLEPARRLVQGQVNRLLYGQRDDPYAVLRALGQRLEGAAGRGEALPGAAETIAGALRLPFVAVLVDGEVVSVHGDRPPRVEKVPLVHRGEVVGALEVGRRRGEIDLAAEDRSLLVDLARQLAAAAWSLRLMRDLVESRRAIVSAREEERRRLHRDLHDDLGPALAGLVLRLETVRDLVRSDPGEAERLLGGLTAGVRDAVDTSRRIVADLRPPMIDDLGLAGALRELAARFASPRLAIATRIEDPGPLPADAEVVVYRVAAEALANVVRHSGASRCEIELATSKDALTLAVVDDGVGIPEGAREGVGIPSIRDRLDEVGGRAVIEAVAGGGTRVFAEVPLVG